MPAPIVFLIDTRGVQSKCFASDLHQESPLGVKAWMERVPCLIQKGKADRPRIPPWCDNEVVFQLPLVPIVEQVHPRIDVVIDDFGVGGHMGVPLPRIIPEQIVAFAREFGESAHLRMGVRPHQPHPQHWPLRLHPRPVPESKDCLRRGEKQRIPLAARKELH